MGFSPTQNITHSWEEGARPRARGHGGLCEDRGVKGGTTEGKRMLRGASKPGGYDETPSPNRRAGTAGRRGGRYAYDTWTKARGAAGGR